MRASAGVSTPAYAYASNNPAAFVDPNGLHDTNGCKFGSSCNACRAQALRMPSGPMRDCVLAQCSNQDTKLKCDEETQKSCEQAPSQSKGNKKVKKGGSALVGSLDNPTHEINWCELPQNEDCQAQALVHELAHSCGWPGTHPPGQNIPGEGDGILKNCGKSVQ